jgi:hypothetical protein
VAGSETARKLRGRGVGDISVGDLVRRIGVRGVGFVEHISEGFATVAFGKDRREIHPLGGLRQVQPKGHSFDARGEL